MPFQSDKPYTFDRVVRLLFILIFIISFFYIIRYLSDVLVPFAIAMLLSYLINPLVEFFEYKTRIRKRTPAVIISLVLVFLVLTLLGLLLVPILIHQLAHTRDLIVNYINSSSLRSQALAYLPTDVGDYLRDIVQRPEIVSFLNGNIGNILTMLKENLLPGVWSVFSGSLSVVTSVIGGIVILLYTVFILLDYERIVENWTSIIPNRFKGLVEVFANDISSSMNSYFRAQLLIALIMGIIHAIGFTIIGLPMGIVLGLFIGILNMVPYLQLAGMIPCLFFSIIHSLEVGGSVWVGIGLLLLIFLIAQLIQDVFLTPRIVGDATGLNPAIIMLSLSVWGKLLGFLGLIIAIPLTTVLVTYYHRFLIHGQTKPLPAEIHPPPLIVPTDNNEKK